MDVKSALKKAHSALRDAGIGDRLEAELLLAHALQKPRAWLLSWPDHELGHAEQASIHTMLERRMGGEPLAYITGQREFWSLPLKVSADTLIPRPETETLVERALERIPADTESRVLDLGAGSGAIALAIASERPLSQVTATDVSQAALAVARENAECLGIRNVELIQGDWLSPVTDQRFDVVVSNPPYVAEGDPHLDEGDLPAEPRVALVASGDGLDAIRHIANAAFAVLDPGGWLLFEHGFDQAKSVAGILERAQYVNIGAYEDLTGILRVSEGQRPR